MPTAAQRAAKAEAKRVAAIGAAGVEDEGLAGLALPALRTEAKRLLGVDYSHTWDHDKEALVEAITQARAERAEEAALAQAERRKALEAELGALGRSNTPAPAPVSEVGEPPAPAEAKQPDWSKSARMRGES